MRNNWFEKTLKSPYAVAGMLAKVNDLHALVSDLEGGKTYSENLLLGYHVELQLLLGIPYLDGGNDTGEVDDIITEDIGFWAATIFPNVHIVTAADDQTKLATVILREREFDGAGFVVPSGSATSSEPTLALFQAFLRLLHSALTQQLMAAMLAVDTPAALKAKEKPPIPYENWMRSGMQGVFDRLGNRVSKTFGKRKVGKVPELAAPYQPVKKPLTFPNRPVHIANAHKLNFKNPIFFDKSTGKQLSDQDTAKIMAFLFGGNRKVH